MGLLRTKSTEVFSRSGACKLMNVNWTEMQDKRTIMASLVQGVYILERDRQKHRRGTQDALAPPWWNSLGFYLEDGGILKDDSDIFGAIFEFKHSTCPSISSSSSCSFTGLENAPQYVVAFRGTMLKKTSIVKDLLLDGTCGLHTLNYSNRFNIAFHAVKKLVGSDLSSRRKVWLAGHSLGSAIAMLVGKKMIREENTPLETYLFNSPFPSVPIESIKNHRIRDGFRVLSSMLRVGTGAVCQAISSKEHPITTIGDDMFDKLCRSGWAPYLFVNREDPICSGFIGYFERRETMNALGLGMIEIISTRTSRACTVIGKVFGTATEPLHVLPSATVVISSSYGPSPIEAHGLSQWYHHGLQCESKLYLVDEMLKITSSSVELPQLPTTDQ